MSETDNIITPATEDKTFTQEQVNAIISERLAKEKSKTDATLAEREQELTRKEFLLQARETLTTKGLPVSLLDALNTSSPEAFTKSLEILEAEKKHIAPTPPPPPYAAGTGKERILGGDTDYIREGMGLK